MTKAVLTAVKPCFVASLRQPPIAILAPPETTEEELGNVEKSTPLGQWGGEMAIAEAVLALLSCGFITGETVRVDGGRHVR